MSSDAKKKKIQEMERQDDEGISRKKWNHTMNPNVFLVLKLLLAVLIPVTYFLYSPLLIFVMLGFVGTFFLARMAERSMNKSVIRSNHIHILKVDAALALIIIVISIAGSFLSLNNKVKTSNFSRKDDFKEFENTEISAKMDNSKFKGMQKQMKSLGVKQYFTNLGSLLTGERNVFQSKQSFGTMKKPDNFVTDESQLDDENFNEEDFDFSKFPTDFDGEKPDGEKPDGDFKGMMKPDFNFSMSDLPISYVSSSAFSVINSILIFSVSGLGLISVVAIFIKKKKFEKNMNEVIFDGKIGMLDSSELERILSFGEEFDETEKTEKTEKQIDEEIQNYKNSDNLILAKNENIKDIEEEKYILKIKKSNDDNDDNFGF